MDRASAVILTDRLVNKIAKIIPVTDIDDVGTEMDIPQNTIATIRNKHSADPFQLPRDLLHAWKNKNGDRLQQAEDLVDIMREQQVNGAVTLIEKAIDVPEIILKRSLLVAIADVLPADKINGVGAALGFDQGIIEKMKIEAKPGKWPLDLLSSWRNRRGSGLNQAEQLKDVMHNEGIQEAVNLLQTPIDAVLPSPPTAPPGGDAGGAEAGRRVATWTSMDEGTEKKKTLTEELRVERS